MQRTRKRRRMRWVFPSALLLCIGGGAWFVAGGGWPTKASAQPDTAAAPKLATANPAGAGAPGKAAGSQVRVPVVTLAADSELVSSPNALSDGSGAFGALRDEELKPGGPMLQLPPSTRPAPTPERPTSAPASAPVRRDPPATQPTSTSVPTKSPEVRTGDSPIGGGTPTPAPSPPSGGALRSAIQKMQSGKLLEARSELSRLLEAAPTGGDAPEIRKHLAKLAEDTIFNKQHLDGDPLSETYKVQAGDKLINIAKQYDTPADVIMMVSGIASANKLGVGQTIKALKGPFNARIYKSQYRLDLYLQDTYVRSFSVGLGTENGTPTGTWKVLNRLKNPTYYPPSSAKDRRVIKPDDPRNPLGEFWVGLEGTEGAAVGTKSYGIHGTIEPESIGHDASMGCVRMLNQDAEFIFRVMQPGKSMVTIVP